jgi:hypothetical protein
MMMTCSHDSPSAQTHSGSCWWMGSQPGSSTCRTAQQSSHHSWWDRHRKGCRPAVLLRLRPLSAAAQQQAVLRQLLRPQLQQLRPTGTACMASQVLQQPTSSAYRASQVLLQQLRPTSTACRASQVLLQQLRPTSTACRASQVQQVLPTCTACRASQVLPLAEAPLRFVAAGPERSGQHSTA